MTEGTEARRAAPGQRHIIRRPRLERLLDETQARIIMLVAPAGYGKTTLARQWLPSDAVATWLTLTPASAGPTAFLLAIARACLVVAPRASERVQDLFATRPDPVQAAAIVAEELRANAIAWLVIDDLHIASASTVEAVIDELLMLTDVRLLIATRQRPTWATSRRLLYGEIFELGRQALAMTHEEAAELLPSGSTNAASALASLAEGWPAVLGLAAIAGAKALPDDVLPERLFEYFADELMSGMPDDVRAAVEALALTPTLDVELSSEIIGPNAPQLLTVAANAGLLAKTHRQFQMHPLLARFINERGASSRRDSYARAENAARVFIAHGQLDEAFALIAEFSFEELLEPLFEAGYEQMLRVGRSDTLQTWIARPFRRAEPGPFELLARSELAFRAGLHERAERLALRAAASSTEHSRHVSTAFRIAGLSAHLRGAEQTALDHQEQAAKHATTPSDVWISLYDRFNAVADLDFSAAQQVLLALEEFEPPTPDAALRLATAHLLAGSRSGDLRHALARAREHESTVEQARDSLAKSAFIHAYAHGLALAGQYDEALEHATAALRLVNIERLGFARPYVLLVSAIAFNGLRRFNEARSALDEVEALVPAADVHVTANAQINRARLLLSQSRAVDAGHALLVPADEIPALALRAEFIATRALTVAIAGDVAKARSDVETALELSTDSLTRSAAYSASVVAGIAEGIDPSSSISGLADHLRQTHVLDPVVPAYRADPMFLRATLGHAACHDVALMMIHRSRDEALLLQGRGPEALSPRERDVLALIAEGLSNRNIAQRLFISEATVKVHVRHILEKLDVKSRTEAALRSFRP